MTRSLPDLLLERHRLNELPGDVERNVIGEIAANPAARARVDALARSDEDIRLAYAPSRFVRPASRRRSRRHWPIGGALAAAVAILLAVMPNLPPSGGDRVKGDPLLAVYRRTPAGSERLTDGTVARAGDVLRLGYGSAGRAYGIILSIDGRGTVTLHLPPLGSQAAALSPGGITLLDTAYELDAAPRIERFYFITAARPFAVAPVLAAAHATPAAPPVLALPAGLDQVTFAVQKEVRK